MPSVVSRDEFAELGVDWRECASPEDVMSERRRRGFYQLLVSAPKREVPQEGFASTGWIGEERVDEATAYGETHRYVFMAFPYSSKTHSPRCSRTCIERSQLL